MGKRESKNLAYLNLQNAHYAAQEIAKIPGMSLAFSGPFFHEFVVETKIEPAKVNALLLEDQIIGGLDLARFYPELDHHLLFCVTETKRKADIDRLVVRLGEIQCQH